MARRVRGGGGSNGRDPIMRQVRTLGLLGTGVICGGWAARALHFGIDVVAADTRAEMEAWLRGAVANAEGALARLTFAPLPAKGTLTFTTDLQLKDVKDVDPGPFGGYQPSPDNTFLTLRLA